jgi:hypothetical protein
VGDDELWRRCRWRARIRVGFDLENVDNLYNSDPETPTLYLHNHLHRCIRAIAIARLSLRPDFERLAIAYREQLKKLGVTELVLDRYDRLWRFLRTYSMN